MSHLLGFLHTLQCFCDLDWLEESFVYNWLLLLHQTFHSVLGCNVTKQQTLSGRQPYQLVNNIPHHTGSNPKNTLYCCSTLIFFLIESCVFFASFSRSAGDKPVQDLGLSERCYTKCKNNVMQIQWINTLNMHILIQHSSYSETSGDQMPNTVQ